MFAEIIFGDWDLECRILITWTTIHTILGCCDFSPDDVVSIHIRDSGSGIAKETIEHIWDPFFTTKEVGKGLGLGLALTYSIVKRHGGEIHVKSKLGEGSQFTVLLPVCRK